MSKESLKRLEEVTRRTFGEPDMSDKDEKGLRLTIERLAAELAEKNILIERCMSMAHVAALFSGGRGEGDPVVGFREIIQHNTELIERNDKAEAEVERLTAELAAEKIHAVEATNVIIEGQAREKALRKEVVRLSAERAGEVR